MEDDSECTHTLVCDRCMSILWYAITYPHWNGVGVCVSWSILRRCTGHPAMYMAAYVQTNPILILILIFLIFDFWILTYCVEVTVWYRKLHMHYYQYKDHTIFLDIFLFSSTLL